MLQDTVVLEIDRYSGGHEIRIKITDLEFELFQDTAYYFYYEKRISKKPNIQELARWCIGHVANENQHWVSQSEMVQRKKQEDQDPMYLRNFIIPPADYQPQE